MKDTSNKILDLNGLLRDNIKHLKPYSSARDEYKGFKNTMLFLDANESPFENGVNRYPDPYQLLLKQRLSELKNVKTSQILLGNGSDEIIDLIFRAFCEPNLDKIITLPPTYGMYDVLAKINAVENIEIPLEVTDFQPDVAQILNTANKHTKLLFLCSPNNPTANSLDSDKIERLLNEFKGIIIIDEAYIDFSSDESWLNRLAEFPNLIVVQTLSKAFGLAGIRLGICYASIKIISVLNKIKPPYNVNELTQERALKELNNQDLVKSQIEHIKTERQILIKQLESIDFIEKIYPSETNFVLIRVDDANKRYHQLLKQNIVIRNRTNQLGCKNCLRITIGTKDENLKLIIALNNMI